VGVRRAAHSTGTTTSGTPRAQKDEREQLVPLGYRRAMRKVTCARAGCNNLFSPCGNWRYCSPACRSEVRRVQNRRAQRRHRLRRHVGTYRERLDEARRVSAVRSGPFFFLPVRPVPLRGSPARAAAGRILLRNVPPCVPDGSPACSAPASHGVPVAQGASGAIPRTQGNPRSSSWVNPAFP